MTVVLDVGDPTPLGRIRLHDARSRDHAVKLYPDTGYSVRHRMDAKHLDQFYLGGCVGFSFSQLLNTRAAKKSRTVFNVKSPRTAFDIGYLDNNDGIENYHQSTLFDPFDWTYPPVDNGSSALGIMKWAKAAGVIRSYSWTFDFPSFIAAVQLQPVLVGTNWYDDMMVTDSKGVLSSGLQGSGGGHEYLANAIRWNRLPSKRLIGFEQSWGEHPQGFKPTFYMPFEMAEELIIRQQGDVAVPELI